MTKVENLGETSMNSDITNFVYREGKKKSQGELPSSHEILWSH